MSGIQEISSLPGHAMRCEEFIQAEDIPLLWDQLAGNNIFLRKTFLHHLERTNPCRQRYRILFDEDIPKAIYVVYRLKLDLFTYSSFCLKFPVWIIGIPCSIAKQGFAVLEGYEQDLADDIRSIKGAKLILNGETPLPGKSGDTLPSCELDLPWKNFGDYLSSMRSHYRYRLKKALTKWQDVKIDLITPDQFDPTMYQQYLAVYERSQYKLEKLNFSFFRNLDLPAQVIKASYDHQVIGFAILVENADELVFLFTGFDHQLNRKFDTYLNLLLEIVNYGLKNGYRVIDFGQTTEGTKQKLGCSLKKKKMFLYHSYPLVDTLANKFLGCLEYQTPNYHFQVFSK